MKILFLDIDGVVLSGEELWASSRTQPHRWLPPHKFEAVDEVLARTGAVVVVSSTWRIHEDCRESFAAAGFHGP